MGDVIDTFNVAASGLSAERLRLQTIATNMANARTTRSEEGGPYQRRVPVFEAVSVDRFGDMLDRETQRVVVSAIESDGSAPQPVYDPSHPDADADGYVEYPNVNILQEMVDLMTASRAYEANATVIDATKAIADRALEIGR